MPLRTLYAPALLALGLAAPAFAGPAAGVGYATSDNYFKRDTRPTLYQPLNLLDARDLTVWCSRGPDSQEDPIRFGFRGPTVVDEIRVSTGNGTDEETFAEFSRAKKISLRSPTSGTTFTVADQRGLQSITLSPPLRGEQLTLEVVDQYTAEDPESPVCITDVVFYSQGKPLNGAYMTQKLKYDKAQATVLGTWFAGYTGAPERYLSFFFDGTYRLLFDPIEHKKGITSRTITGDYEVHGGKVVLSIPGKGKISGKVSGAKGGSGGEFDSPAAAARSISFEGGKDLPEDLKEPFRDRT